MKELKVRKVVDGYECLGNMTVYRGEVVRLIDEEGNEVACVDLDTEARHVHANGPTVRILSFRIGN